MILRQENEARLARHFIKIRFKFLYTYLVLWEYLILTFNKKCGKHIKHWRLHHKKRDVELYKLFCIALETSEKVADNFFPPFFAMDWRQYFDRRATSQH